ncbi:rhamnogalacturonan lyase [Paractinoplanes rishiriensis]|uniref:Rhamnogalacturonan I lyase beta-sheet domain-containing protein n=1 Tax=Paractinoplanes rishiriensis TaxID=1050105 RepID=A0A919KAE3_9ACTN|nr:rhamnogalacturonan lyase [Actinoplanes rishiriensis]GIF01675.1 hypothetical protein Ari01nite_91390 [Actinoplanes rishiriensis]
MFNRIRLVAGLAAVLVLGPSGAAVAHPAPEQRPRMERLDRGLVAAVTPDGVFLSWRLLDHEERKAFRVLRDGRLIATVTGSTNYLDRDGDASSVYHVGNAAVRPWSQGWIDMPLQKPADGVTPAGVAYTYRANDMSVGDVDGDGALEYVVKWDPTNQKDNSQVGYTGNVHVDTYELDGTLKNRIDLGVNIRAGAHYTQFLVYDFDGDGKAEIMLKTAPGTRSGTGAYVTMPRGDLRAGFRNTDDYRLSPAGYYEHLVTTFRGWHAHPEVVAGRWPATLEQAFGIEPRYAYPLSDADARALTDYYMDVYAPSRSANNKPRQFEGFILSGPEYLSVFAGDTGRELQTIHYQPGRTDDGLMWNDYAGGRIEPGNRGDRFLATVAYLNGRRPSAVFARGYYSRSTLVAYDWDGRRLHERWFADSGWVTVDNPFNGKVFGGATELAGQGFHSLSSADVDNDGKQEIVYGSATLDDDGSLLYSSADVMPPGTPDAGTIRPLGHGDAMHVADIDPARPGLEIFTAHENSRAPYGYALREAATGKVIYGAFAGRDVGRGMVGDVVPEVPGLETWANVPDGSGVLGVRSATGETLSNTTPGTNMSIRWAADMTTQIVTGSGDATPMITDWRRGTLLTATGTLTNNSTKGNPALVADIFGDWREELLLRTTDSSAIRIYLSTEVTDRRLPTLLHDPQYRVETARQQTGYNQPAYPSFYLGSALQIAVPQ